MALSDIVANSLNELRHMAGRAISTNVGEGRALSVYVENSSVQVAAAGKYYDENGNLLTVKRAFANVAASQTDADLVTAVTSKKIRVLSLNMVTAATATNVTFNSKPGGAGTAISPLYANGSNGGIALNYHPFGYFETTAGQGLSVTTGAGSTTGIHVTYVEV